MIVAGDDDYILDGVLRVLLAAIVKHRGVALFHLKKEAVPRRVQRGKGALEYLSYVGFLMTWISGIVMRRDLYLSLEEPQKCDDTRIPQVYLQMEMLKRNPEFAVLYGRVLAEGSGDHEIWLRFIAGWNLRHRARLLCGGAVLRGDRREGSRDIAQRLAGVF